MSTPATHIRLILIIVSSAGFLPMILVASGVQAGAEPHIDMECWLGVA